MKPFIELPYFIEYNAHASIMRAWIYKDFFQKIISIFQEYFHKN